MTDSSSPSSGSQSDRGPSPEFEQQGRSEGQKHLRFGFFALLLFLSLGFLLEFFHGFRIGFYLSEETQPRRLMWTLSHTHGTLIALLHIALGAAWSHLRPSPRLRLASLCLYAAACLLPAGFFLGGLFVYPPDPGLVVVLVPIGGVFLFIGVGLVARQT
ncbi:MAG: hypothetical protein H8E78_01520 [Proteobacteria bacterium]|nr:hypothetical protein [Pseudomonadota bacterium]